ncbi:hypothetical protein B0H17DRAFT_937412 [Mycena rosella]|uniref:DUF7729 domain-containing protein n=1 Tax=Mycena rosella TaxID=1033263 RepID=A0AAD7DG61_MYCRO|nr:hypothetical protein B0H17DRAFT_937412 [Mycena rosella]
MFTPPPSPGQAPRTTSRMASSSLIPSLKRRIGRRTRWTVVLVPMALILITASTRYLTHPAAFDMFSEPTLNWETLSNRASDWTPHKRHPQPAPAPADNANAASTLGSLTLSGSITSLTGTTSGNPASPTSTLPTADQTVPTIPASPPDLPTPFPQPFDSDLSQNFSSVSCFNFFANMTNTVAFRACRPFSFLLQSSADFIEAQDNLTTLNNIVWGTCNTSFTEDDCSTNMAWFSSNLESSCASDLKDGNSMAVGTQIALNAFDVMRSAGCLVDPTTNTYCYLDAVRNSNPSDTYFYSLPLGVSMPNNTIASCSACTKSLMTLYYGALDNSSQSAGLKALKSTYNGAAKIAAADCGTAYATLTTTASNGALPARTAPRRLIGSFAVALALSLLSLL